jgi:hypothetical protein
MPVPTHREGCHTMIWRTNCPDCNRPVWFFSCSCGSKVFFETKGYPWNLHADNCPIYNIRLMLESGTSAGQIRKLLESQALHQNVKIPPLVEDFLSKYGAVRKPILKEVLPDDEPMSIQGIVKSVNLINLYKRLNLIENQIIRKMMGKFASEEYFEVIVQEKPSVKQSTILYWRFLIPTALVKGYGFQLGLTIDANLQAQQVFEDAVFWVATHIDWK